MTVTLTYAAGIVGGMLLAVLATRYLLPYLTNAARCSRCGRLSAHWAIVDKRPVCVRCYSRGLGTVNAGDGDTLRFNTNKELFLRATLLGDLTAGTELLNLGGENERGEAFDERAWTTAIARADARRLFELLTRHLEAIAFPNEGDRHR